MRSKSIKLLHWDIFTNYPIKTGITTRIKGYSISPYTSFNLATHTGDSLKTVIKNRTLLTNKIGCSIESYTHLNQVHGDKIEVINSFNIGSNNQDADALITDNPEALLNIYVADCVPIILYDPKNHVGGLCHCGWKGTYKKLLRKTISSLSKHYGSDPSRLLIGIGPSIGKCCYNVSEELYKDFSPKNKEGSVKNGKYYLDLKQINRQIAINAGVDVSNIEVMNLCTSCNNNLFYSHRKEGEPSGRFSCYLNLSFKQSTK